jgi:DNA-binding CsgD family transcriptional regulator
LANSQLAEAQQSLHRIGSPLEIRAIWQLAIVAVELGELDRAIQLAADVQAYCRAHDIPSVIDLHLQALIAVSRGELGLAEGLFTETINASVRCNDRHLLHEAQRELGHVLLDHGCVDRARGFLAEALETECAYGGWAHVARDLEAVARSVALTLPGAAVRLAGAADGMRAARNASQWPSDRRRLASWLPEVRRRLKGSFYTMAWQAGRLLNAEQALTLARSAVQPAATAPRRQLDVLTRRERDVLALLAGALSNQAIATELNISLATTRTHVDHILVKLGLHSRTQLAVWANQHEPSHRNASY